MKKTTRAALSAAILILAALLIVGTASASTPGAGSVTAGSNTTATAPTSTGSSSASGGYVTELNVSTSTQQTTNWQGFWGNVTGGTIYLNDSASNTFKSWTANVSNGGYVYATTKSGSAPSWSTVTSVTAATLDGSSYWNLAGKSDNISSTYSGSNSITVAGRAVTSAIGVTLHTYFNDYVIADTASPSNRNNIIWAAAINNDKTNFKTTTSSDYELLVPVVAGDTYYFYLEIL